MNPRVPWMPPNAYIANARSGGMPNNFPLQTIDADGGRRVAAVAPRACATSTPRRTGIRPTSGTSTTRRATWSRSSPTQARADTSGDYPIRIYTIGMGELVRYNLGTRQEMSEDILKRIANDTTSPDCNATQLEGKYYFAATPDDVGPAFAALQNQIIRLTK